MIFFFHLQGESERAKEIALALQQKMDELEREMRYAAAKRVAEDFKDPLGPLNALTTATMAPLGEYACTFWVEREKEGEREGGRWRERE